MGAALERLRGEARLGPILADRGFLLAYAPGWDSLFVVTAWRDSAEALAAARRPEAGGWLLPAEASPAAREELAARAPAESLERFDLGGTTLWLRGAKPRRL